MKELLNEQSISDFRGINKSRKDYIKHIDEELGL